MRPNKQLERTLEREGFVTVARAAALLRGVREGTIYEWIASNRVAARRIGKRVFVEKAGVERLLGLVER